MTRVLSDEWYENLLRGIMSAGKPVKVIDAGKVFIEVAARSISNKFLFQHMIPVFECDTSHWIPFVIHNKNGFEVLKWFARHGRVSRKHLLEELLKYDHHHSADVKPIIDYFSELIQSENSEAASCKYFVASSHQQDLSSKVEPASDKVNVGLTSTEQEIKSIQCSKSSEQGSNCSAGSKSEDQKDDVSNENPIDANITEAMVIAVRNKRHDCLLALIGSKRGDPDVAGKLLIEDIESSNPNFDIKMAENLLCGLIMHPNFDTKNNANLYVLATIKGWVQVIEALNKRIV